MLYILLIFMFFWNLYVTFKFCELKDKPKKPEEHTTDEEMLEKAKKLINKADLNNINQAALNIWYNHCLRQVKLLRSKEIKFNIID